MSGDTIYANAKLRDPSEETTKGKGSTYSLYIIYSTPHGFLYFTNYVSKPSLNQMEISVYIIISVPVYIKLYEMYLSALFS